MNQFGCVHYKRKVTFVTPCCDKEYSCRLCHDENEETHSLDRKMVTHLVCSVCDAVQPVRKSCLFCHSSFGEYACLTCRLFDDEDKGQFHCSGCGICRVGGRHNYFHCNTCNMCLPISKRLTHKCVENASLRDCAVCLQDLHSSRAALLVPDCGHLIHPDCKEQLLANGHYVCPICQCSIIDMTAVWKRYDMEILKSPMPEEFKENADILCRDCQQYCTVPYHVIGLKCKSCGSYNTTRTRTVAGTTTTGL